MASNNATFESGCLDDFEDSENVSEMVAETSETSKDRQSESATSENNRLANLSERDLEKILEDNQIRARKTLIGVFSTFKGEFQA